MSASSPDRIPLLGASAGSLAATLAVYDVSFEDATNCAVDLSKKIGLWDRPLGLAFIWGSLIEDWLDELLPPSNSFEVPPPGDLNILVSPATIPSVLGFSPRDCITAFKDREDVINANMASIHLPLFLNKKLSRPFRGNNYIDGSFQSKPSDYSSVAQDVITLDYAGDDKLNSSPGGFVSLVSIDGVWKMMEFGREYAKKLEGEGYFKALENH